MVRKCDIYNFMMKKINIKQFIKKQSTSEWRYY